MWHFERVLVGQFKGAFMHPFFQRGNKELCAAMSRHLVPPAELYQQALAASDIRNDIVNHHNVGRFNQYMLTESPNQLMIIQDRITNDIDPNSLKLAERNLRLDLMKRVMTTEESNAKPRAQEMPQKHVHHRRETVYLENDSRIAVQTSKRGKNANTEFSSFDQGAHWSLLSGCIERALHRDLSPELADHFSEEQGTDLSSIDNKFIPFDALTPSMEVPASPEAIEELFSEFESL
jgi:hypothetical protein